MNRRLVIILCAAIAAGGSTLSRADPPSTIFIGGPYDGHAFAQRNAYAAPASATARFIGGFFDGHDFTQLITYSAPTNAVARFAGGALDGYTFAERDAYIAPANANARFSGSRYDGYAFTERDTFDLATLTARFAGGSYDGSDVTAAGPYPNPLNRDTDGDGIADWWEAQYFHDVFSALANVDQDGDGFTTWQEYVADTDPRDPASRFEIKFVSVTNTATVQFTSSSNRLYTFEYSTNLPSGVWPPVPGDPQRYGVGGFDVFADPSAAPNRAYRVRVNGP